MIIAGAGVAGLFTAIQLLNKGYPGKDILILDKGHMLNKRKCFVDSKTACKKCKICSISNGVGGSGSFSDSKLNFDTSGRVGGNLHEIYTRQEIATQLNEVYDIYRQFGVEEFKSKEYGTDVKNKLLLKRIQHNPFMELSECITIHLGTDNSRIVYQRMVDFLLENGVTIKSNYEVKTVQMVRDEFIINGELTTPILVLALGRSGNKLMRTICEQNGVKMQTGAVDIGVRVETLNKYMQQLNDNFYEAKIYIRGDFDDVTRVFCTNPSGVVSIESYPHGDKNIYLANGHAYADANKKTENTNFALLVTRHFNEDTPDPLNDYMYPIIQACNALGKGQVIMQGLEDIKRCRRSTEARINRLDIKPTVKAYPGDLTSVLPFRTMLDILQAIEQLDTVAPGLNGPNTILYGPEAKFHANKVVINKECESSIPNLYCIGDSSGWTRGLTSAASMGITCAKSILKKG